ncbi:MAG: response regulator [Pseudomonadota bacterium]
MHRYLPGCGSGSGLSDGGILVVDDMAAQRELAVVMIGKLGYTADSVPSGEAAVACVQKLTVDGLLLDMIMDPGIDGQETYRRIIHIHPDQKAVIASGYAETERMKEARHLGAGVTVGKPYTLEIIGKAVHQVLHG